MLRLVLDTNVVLDWLVFADPTTHPFREALGAGRVEIVSAAVPRCELVEVLARPAFGLTPARQAELLREYDAAARLSLEAMQAPEPLPAKLPRCRDPDDQPFIELAWRARAALVSRDLKVLALRRRAAQCGLRILTLAELSTLLEAG